MKEEEKKQKIFGSGGFRSPALTLVDYFQKNILTFIMQEMFQQCARFHVLLMLL